MILPHVELWSLERLLSPLETMGAGESPHSK